MNLHPLIQRRSPRHRLQQRREAEPVHTKSVPPHLLVHQKGLLGLGPARQLAQELVGNTAVGPGDLGEDGEGVVEAGREGGRGVDELEEEGVGGVVELEAAEDLGVDLFEVGEGGRGRESIEEGGGGVGREG